MTDEDSPNTDYPDLYEQYPGLYHDYPEVAPIIYRKIDQRGEEWVLENWYAELLPASVVLDIPEKEELPFFDPEQHESWSNEKQAEMAKCYGEYRQNLKEAGSDTE